VRSSRSVCVVVAYPPAQRRLGGGGWVDRRLVATLLAAGLSVDLVSVTGSQRVWIEDGVTGRAAGDIPLEVRSNPRMLARVAARMMRSGEPYLASKFTAFTGWSAAVALLRDRAGAVPVVTSGWPALLLAEAAQISIAAHVAHNVDTTIARTHAPMALRALGEVRRLDRTERRLLARPATRFALSRHDAQALTALSLPTAHLPLPLRAAGVRPPTVPRAVGFIGKASWPPNAHALRTLLGPVHEELERYGADIRFVLAGVGTQQYAWHPRVVRTGWIDDEADFYRQVGLVVVPRFGPSTGISIKMLEATEYGVAAVVPRELRDAVDPHGPWIVADDSADTACAITSWSRDPHRGDPTHYLGRAAEAAPSALLRALGC